MINILGVDDSMTPVLAMADAALPIPGATSHLYGKAESRKSRKMGHITVTANSEAELRSHLRPILKAQPDLGAEFIDSVSPKHNVGKSHAYPLVGIIMGSDSDLPVMLPATKILDKFGIPYELTITSAHRTPARMVEYAHSAVGRGLRVIIAGAGGAAHLPGMVASETAVPVIGVPVKASVLDGVDSLYSIVQMPVSLVNECESPESELIRSAGSQSLRSESTTRPTPLCSPYVYLAAACLSSSRIQRHTLRLWSRKSCKRSKTSIQKDGTSTSRLG